MTVSGFLNPDCSYQIHGFRIQFELSSINEASDLFDFGARISCKKSYILLCKQSSIYDLLFST